MKPVIEVPSTVTPKAIKELEAAGYIVIVNELAARCALISSFSDP